MPSGASAATGDRSTGAVGAAKMVLPIKNIDAGETPSECTGKPALVEKLPNSGLTH